MMYVEEKDLNFSYFHCCGDEDLYPFKCSNCNHLMVFCYECGTLYSELSNLSKTDTTVNHFNPDKPSFLCPKCSYGFEYYFMNNPSYHITFQEWIAAGYSHLLNGTLSNNSSKI